MHGSMVMELGVDRRRVVEGGKAMTVLLQLQLERRGRRRDKDMSFCFACLVFCMPLAVCHCQLP